MLAIVMNDYISELGIGPDANTAARHRRPVFRDVNISRLQPGTKPEFAPPDLV